MQRRKSKSILGETVNISSTGLLFKAAEPIPSRRPLEMVIDWPVAAPHGGVLKLELQARTIRCDGNLVAVDFQSHHMIEFGGMTSTSGSERVEHCALR